MRRDEFNNVYSKVKNPQRVAIAICLDKENKPNPITLEWFMKTSIEPPMFAVSIGHTRYSYECFLENRFFNLILPSKEMKREAIICGSKSGRDIDKMKECNFEWFEGRFRKLPIIKNASAVFECETITQVKSGDHTIFVGQVKYSWIDESNAPLTLEDLRN